MNRKFRRAIVAKASLALTREERIEQERVRQAKAAEEKKEGLRKVQNLRMAEIQFRIRKRLQEVAAKEVPEKAQKRAFALASCSIMRCRHDGRVAKKYAMMIVTDIKAPATVLQVIYRVPLMLAGLLCFAIMAIVTLPAEILLFLPVRAYIQYLSMYGLRMKQNHTSSDGLLRQIELVVDKKENGKWKTIVREGFEI